MTKRDADAFVFINWLRGLAALLVFFFHIDVHVFHDYPKLPIPRDSFTYHFVLGDFDLGKYAVGVFFMVSGFLIPATLNATGITLRTYAIHRFFRLYPAYWLSIVVFVMVELVLARHANLNLRDLLVNVTMLQKFLGVPDVVGAYWTLQIELIFYVLCALLFLSGQLFRRELVIAFALAAAILCAWLRYRTGKELPVALFIALALMFLGDCLRAHAGGGLSGRRVAWITTAVSLALAPICLLAYKSEGIRYWLSYSAAIATFLTSFIARGHISRFSLANKLGQFLADCSYSVYLLHGTVGLATARYVYATTGNPGWTALWAIGGTIVLAYLSYRLVEYPGIRLGRKLGQSVSDAGMARLYKLNMADKKSF
jgi:peptidoglycan/LPS O-acetylase OafA/YrhL